MICEIISVGTEVVTGDIIDTNAPYLSKELISLGIDVMFRVSVRDDDETIRQALTLAKERSDLIITIGGLGPTYDDFTKEEVASVNGLKLVRDEKIALKIKDYFEKTGRVMTENNLSQADIIEGSNPIDNDNGTAPGILLEKDGKTFILLPGPPNELKPMFENKIKPYLINKTGKFILERTVKLSGIGESFVENDLKDLILKVKNPIIATYAKTGECHVKLTAEGNTMEEAQKILAPYLEKVEIRFSKYIYGYDSDSLSGKAVELLKKKGMKVSFCESCTGGFISKTITDVPGASDVFDCGMVTYSNEMKSRLVGVSPIALSKVGAVSEEVAHQMAKGVRCLSGADIGISVTGIAGPGGGSDEKPVGLVYMGFSTPTSTVTKRFHFRGNREKVRQSTVNAVLSALINYLK